MCVCVIKSCLNLILLSLIWFCLFNCCLMPCLRIFYSTIPRHQYFQWNAAKFWLVLCAYIQPTSKERSLSQTGTPQLWQLRDMSFLQSHPKVLTFFFYTFYDKQEYIYIHVYFNINWIWVIMDIISIIFIFYPSKSYFRQWKLWNKYCLVNSVKFSFEYHCILNGRVI